MLLYIKMVQYYKKPVIYSNGSRHYIYYKLYSDGKNVKVLKDEYMQNEANEVNEAKSKDGGGSGISRPSSSVVPAFVNSQNFTCPFVNKSQPSFNFTEQPKFSESSKCAVSDLTALINEYYSKMKEIIKKIRKEKNINEEKHIIDDCVTYFNDYCSNFVNASFRVNNTHEFKFRVFIHCPSPNSSIQSQKLSKMQQVASLLKSIGGFQFKTINNRVHLMLFKAAPLSTEFYNTTDFYKSLCKVGFSTTAEKKYDGRVKKFCKRKAILWSKNSRL